MKRGTSDHPKVDHLSALLGIPRYGAVGILNLIWDWAGRYVPQGDVGKYSDEVIARKLEWQGEPRALVEALVAARWLDLHQTHRLIIHDWPDHCEDSTHTHLARQALHFANGSRPKMARLPEKERASLTERFAALESAQKRADAPQSDGERSTLPLPLPLPEPLPEPEVPPASTTKKRATRLPDDFFVTEDHKRFAADNGLPDPQFEIDRFRDYWQAKAGKDAAKVDWDATFRNWLRNAAQYRDRAEGSRSGPREPCPVQSADAGKVDVAHWREYAADLQAKGIPVPEWAQPYLAGA